MTTSSEAGSAVHPSTERRLPLRGVRVLDFCWVVAGPQITAMLADLGAEVIKVESTARMDGTRLGRPMIGDDVAGGDAGAWPELQPLFHSMNRNKLGITLNLAEPEGVEIARKLVSVSDVVTDNFSAGTLERIGLGYDELRKIKPSIVALSLSGTGQDGPMKGALTYTGLVVGLSGLANQLGYEGERPLGFMKSTYGDTHASLFSAVGLMAALFRARRTGVGDYLDVSQWEATICGLEFQILRTLEETEPRARGNSHPWMAPHGIYRCAGDDDWIAISCANDDQWHALCSVLELGDAASEPRFADALRRLHARSDLDRLVEEHTAKQDRFLLAEALQAAGVPAAPVMNVKDQFESPHFRARGIHVEAHHPKIGYEVLQALPWKTYRAGRGEMRRGAPLLGQDNDYVFSELLKLSAAEMSDLTERGVIR